MKENICNKYFPFTYKYVAMQWKKQTDHEEMLKMARYSMHIGFWMCQCQWHRFWDCTFRCFWAMGYMLHYLGNCPSQDYFLNILQHYSKGYTWRKYSKYSMFLWELYFFLIGRSKIFYGIRFKFHLERAKGRVRGIMRGEAQDEVCFFFVKFPLLSEIQTLSHKLLVRQTSNHNQFFLVKKNFVHF